MSEAIKEPPNLYKQFKGDVYKALKFIATNNLKIEVNGHNGWKDSTLRSLVKDLVGNKDDKEFYNWYLSYYRIKYLSKEKKLELQKSFLTADENED